MVSGEQMSKVSVIIPSRNEELYLNKTIRNVLENSVDVEVIAILDGWEPSERIEDPRVVYIAHEKALGQRPSINEAARIATGKYVMKLDAHCAVGPKFDRILARDCEYDMTMIPAMFNLDVETWKPRLFDDWDLANRKGKFNPYMYIGWEGGRLRTQYYGGSIRNKIYEAGKGKQIDETMSCMGPCFFMHKDRFWELDGCDEGHGHWGQQGIEVACKAWLSGGRLMVNKNTWFAHFFRGGGVPEGHKGGFPYPISQRQVDAARTYSEDLWLGDKWPKQKRTMEWLVKKFNPPGWEGFFDLRPELGQTEGVERINLNGKFYKHIHRGKQEPKWKGVQILKMPTDLILYAEVIQETKPQVIVEIGTKYGGSALYFQDMMDMTAHDEPLSPTPAFDDDYRRVITIDTVPQVAKMDARIKYIIGSSTDKDVIKQVQKATEGRRTMVVIDGNHNRRHVKWELRYYSGLVTPGQYLVIEDCYIDRGLYGPGEARDWFLGYTRDFEQTNRCQKYIVGVCMGGWLRRRTG